MIRHPVVAGQFYPSSKASLEDQIRRCIDETAKKEVAIGLVSPHAGYIYSGPVAGATISRIVVKNTFVILGPNHTGAGKPFSIMTEGVWKMPLGDVEIDSELARAIIKCSRYLEEDHKAHLFEHSIEVQLPFLQYVKPEVKIVPIILSHSQGEKYKKIGREIARAIVESKKEVVVMASSDMTHYEPHATAKAKDAKAIEAIVDLNEDELLRRVEHFDISMCGYAPVTSLIVASKALGATSAELITYQTSGDTSGDYSSVVGYAGIIIK